MPKLTAIIDSSDRVAITVSKQILIPKGTIGRNCYNIRCIRADEPSKLRAIVPAIEVVKPRLGVVVVAPVAEGVFVAHGIAAGVGNSALAPGVVAVSGHHLARSRPHDGDDVPLHIIEVVIQRVAVGEAHPLARAVVEEQHGSVPGLLGQDLAAVEEKLRLGAVHRLAGADAVGIVLVAIGVAAVGDFPQLTPLPAVAGAVVAGHVPDGVMADGLAVVLRQQVAPAAVVDVGAGLQGRRRQGSSRKGVVLYRLDIPGAVVGIDEGGVLGLTVVAGQLVFLVVGVFLPQRLGVVSGPDPLGGDVPGLVVGVIQIRHIQQTAGMGIVDAPHQGGGAVFVAGPVHIRVGRRGVAVVRAGLVGGLVRTGEAVVGSAHLADAEEGRAGGEVVRRGVGIGRSAGHSIIMIAEFGGLVNGVVPVLQPVAVRAVHPGGTALLHIKSLR